MMKFLMGLLLLFVLSIPAEAARFSRVSVTFGRGSVTRTGYVSRTTVGSYGYGRSYRDYYGGGGYGNVALVDGYASAPPPPPVATYSAPAPSPAYVPADPGYGVRITRLEAALRYQAPAPTYYAAAPAPPVLYYTYYAPAPVYYSYPAYSYGYGSYYGRSYGGYYGYGGRGYGGYGYGGRSFGFRGRR